MGRQGLEAGFTDQHLLEVLDGKGMDNGSPLARTTAFLAILAVPLLSIPNALAAEADAPIAELRRLIETQVAIQEAQLRLLKEQAGQLAAQTREIEELKKKVAACGAAGG
jgi:hypothetical protein